MAVMRNSKYLVMFLIILILNLQQVSAQDLQGLSWGLEVGDKLEYIWSTTGRNESSHLIQSVTDNITLEITDLGPISSSHFSWIGDINHADVTFTNGSYVPFSVSWTAIPIGNWTLMEELLTVYTQGPDIDRLDFSLSESSWTVEIDRTNEDTGGVSNVTREYSRLDGALLYEYAYIEDYPYDYWVHTNELTRINPPTTPVNSLLESMVVIVVSAGIGVLVLAVIFIKLRRGKLAS